MIYVDATKFKQVTLNLLSNSVKFTEPRGRIQVDSVLHNSGDLVLSIKDTGIGIPADKLDVIFEKFTQADGSMTRRYGGTGLGLTIVKQLIEMMGGMVGVESQEKRGSTFWIEVTLPICASPVSAPEVVEAMEGVRP